MRSNLLTIALCTSTCLSTTSHADIARGDLEITDIYTDLDDWLADAPEVTVIDFTEFANGTQIDDEYADLGVNFVSGFYTINDSASCVDDWCLDGNATTIVMEFDESFNVIGVMFPGTLRFVLYLADELVGWTANVQVSGSSGQFGGLITDIMFDEVHVIDSSGDVNIDNLYFSFLVPPVPAPAAALPLFALAAVTGRRRRRA